MSAERTTSAAPKSRSRRDFLRSAGGAVAGTAFAASLAPRVHAAEDNTIRLALIGCGGRGAGAAADALSASGGPVKLHAMADVFDDKLSRSHQALSQRFGSQIDVPPERRFVGFDGYRQAIDSLRPGDIALLTTNAYCRPTHLDYAVDKGLHVFMEKSFAPDPAGLHRMLRAGERAQSKNLKIAGGLMCRHSVARQEFVGKVRAGELGEILLIRAYRMGGADWLGPRPAAENEIAWQIRNRSSFHWVSSGHFIEYMIHQIDECCWLKDSFPVSALGLGGRVPGSPDCSQNLDTYAVEYTFADGTKAQVSSRDMNQCHGEFATFVHGTKRAGQFSGDVHRATVHTFKDQRHEKSNIDWKAAGEPCSPWQAEWNVLLAKIRNDEPHNETQRCVYTNFASLMARAAVHTGQIVTWDQVLASQFQFVPDVDHLSFNSPSPFPANAEGRYPVPIPGQWIET